MKYRVDQIVKVRNVLSTLPEVTIEDKERITSLEAITLLSDVLRSLEKKGYTTQMLVKVLNDQGVDISVSTLRRYLKRSTADHPDGQRRKPKSAVPAKTKMQASKPPSPSSSQPSPAGGKKSEAAATSQKSSGFEVRKDTDNI